MLGVGGISSHVVLLYVGGGRCILHTDTPAHTHPTHLVQCWWCEEEQCSSDAEAPLYDVIQIVKVK